MTLHKLSSVSFSILFLLLLIVRLFFSIKHRKGIVNIRNSQENSVNFNLRRFILGPALGAALIFYFINPAWINILWIPFPLIFLWIGNIAGLIGILILVWIHICLGKEWSADLKLNAGHMLVETGPYSKVRHPMYTSLFIIYISLGIISFNYIILTIFILIIISSIIRVPDEEKMMKEQFGERYEIYMRKTGRFLPEL